MWSFISWLYTVLHSSTTTHTVIDRPTATVTVCQINFRVDMYSYLINLHTFWENKLMRISWHFNFIMFTDCIMLYYSTLLLKYMYGIFSIIIKCIEESIRFMATSQKYFMQGYYFTQRDQVSSHNLHSIK